MPALRRPDEVGHDLVAHTPIDRIGAPCRPSASGATRYAEEVQDPAPARLAAMTGDLEHFARAFLDVLDRLGPEAAARYLGGLAEWCGSDLTDGLFLLPLPLWRRLDAIAADLQAACEAVLAAPDGAAARAAERRVRAAAVAAVTLGREGREPAA